MHNLHMHRLNNQNTVPTLVQHRGATPEGNSRGSIEDQCTLRSSTSITPDFFLSLLRPAPPPPPPPPRLRHGGREGGPARLAWWLRLRTPKRRIEGLKSPVAVLLVLSCVRAAFGAGGALCLGLRLRYRRTRLRLGALTRCRRPRLLRAAGLRCRSLDGRVELAEARVWLALLLLLLALAVLLVCLSPQTTFVVTFVATFVLQLELADHDPTAVATGLEAHLCDLGGPLPRETEA